MGLVLRVLVFALCFTWAAWVQAASVVILRPPSPSLELAEALFRLQGELLAVGLEVRMAEGASSRASVAPEPSRRREPAARGDADAVIDVVSDDASMAVDIWLAKPSSEPSDVLRVVVEKGGSDSARTLAIRALEVLRSRLVELDLAAARRRTSAVTPAPRDAGVVPEPGRVERFGVEAGGALLSSLDGVGPALLPLVRFGWAPRPWLVVQATVAGLGSRPSVSNDAGTVRVRQDYGVLGLCYCSARDAGLRPFLALSAGVLRTSTIGRAAPPARGHAVDRWSFLVDGGLGASLRLPGRFYLTLASHVQLAEPYVSIHVVDAVVASTGRPNLLVSLTAGAWL